MMASAIFISVMLLFIEIVTVLILAHIHFTTNSTVVHNLHTNIITMALLSKNGPTIKRTHHFIKQSR